MGGSGSRTDHVRRGPKQVGLAPIVDSKPLSLGGDNVDRGDVTGGERAPRLTSASLATCSAAGLAS